MARIPRCLKVFSGFALHKVLRGHNKEWIFKTDYEKLSYLEFMNKDLENERFQVGTCLEALTLMSNHTHEISRPVTPHLFSEHMRRHHSKFGAFYNKLKNRCGKVSQDRAHTTLLADWAHEIEAVCYVHANPIRANMVRDARNYRWSTHRLYAFGTRENWMRNIKLPQWYTQLGRNMEKRQREYRKIFARYLKEHSGSPQNFLKKTFHGPILWRRVKETAVSAWRKDHNSPPD